MRFISLDIELIQRRNPFVVLLSAAVQLHALFKQRNPVQSKIAGQGFSPCPVQSLPSMVPVPIL